MSLTMGTSFLLFLPALIFYVIICIKDNGDRESVPLRAILIVSGVIAAVPVFLAEIKLQSIMDGMFQKYVTINVNGEAIYSSQSKEIVHALLCGFVCSALIEGVAKFLLLYFITHKSKEFASVFDGIFYSILIAVGFCITERIIYAFMVGWETFFVKFLLSLPGVIFIGTVTGLFYSLWHTYYAAAVAEKKFTEEKEIENKKPIKYRFWLALSLAVTIIIRGLDVFAQLMNQSRYNIVFYAVIVLFYIFAFINVFRVRKGENLEYEVIDRVLSDKYTDYKKKDGDSNG